MELTELMKSKVSEVVTTHLADDILRLKEIQERLNEYRDLKKGEGYEDTILKANDHLAYAMYEYLLLMSREFTDSIQY